MTGAVEGRLAEAWVKVRTLHAPEFVTYTAYAFTPRAEQVTTVLCKGCPDNSGGEYLRVLWAECPTARIVYPEREIAAALAGTPPEDDATEAPA